MCKTAVGCAPEHFSKTLYVMHRIFTCFIVFAGFVCLWACTPEKKEANHFFDLKGYAQGQIARLDSLKPLVRKNYIFRGVSESQDTKDINWANELKPFIDSDINKAAWIHSYKTDSVRSDAMLIISYTAIDTALTTREIKILLRKNHPPVISVKNSKRNVLYKTIEELWFDPANGYFIKGTQQAMGASRMPYEVYGFFITQTTGIY